MKISENLRATPILKMVNHLYRSSEQDVVRKSEPLNQLLERDGDQRKSIRDIQKWLNVNKLTKLTALNHEEWGDCVLLIVHNYVYDQFLRLNPLSLCKLELVNIAFTIYTKLCSLQQCQIEVKRGSYQCIILCNSQVTKINHLRGIRLTSSILYYYSIFLF